MVRILWVVTSLSLLLSLPPAAPAGRQGQAYALPDQARLAVSQGNPFFSQEALVELTLYLPLEEVLKDRGATPRLHPARISYHDATGAAQTLAVQVRARGHRRKDPAVCEFPPLLVKLPPESGATALFGDARELKLVTHCLADNYILREYLVYKLYNVVTDASFRVRLCRITYRDSRERGKTTVHYAFFVEEAEAMALRNQATLVPKRFFIGMQQTDQRAMVTLAFFQYMVANTDWSVPYRHNTRLLSMNPYAEPIPVPYDFDYTGLVMAPYAIPPEQLGITSVRQRLFRGYSFPAGLYDEARELFNARQPAFYSVYQLSPYLNQTEKAFALRFLDEFYDTLNDSKEFQRSIVRAGLRNEKKYTNVKGLE